MTSANGTTGSTGLAVRDNLQALMFLAFVWGVLSLLGVINERFALSVTGTIVLTLGLWGLSGLIWLLSVFARLIAHLFSLLYSAEPLTRVRARMRAMRPRASRSVRAGSASQASGADWWQQQMDKGLVQAISYATTEQAKLDAECKVFPLRRPAPIHEKLHGGTITLTYDTLLGLPSFLKSTVTEHLEMIPALDDDDPKLGRRRGHYYVRNDGTRYDCRLATDDSSSSES